MRRLDRLVAGCLPLLLSVFLGGCDTQTAPSSATASAADAMRIVSLSPAITQVLVELDLADRLVAVGDYDEFAPVDTPSLGRYVDLDLERLTMLEPTHVLSMTGSAGLPPRVVAMADGGAFELADLTYPTAVSDAVQLIREVGSAVDYDQQAAELAYRLDERLRAIRELTDGRPRPSTLLVFDPRGLMASGPGSVNDELLHLAGGRNAASEAAVAAPVFDREAILELAPDVVFVMDPGGAPWSGPSDPRMGLLADLEVPAVRDGRVVLLNDPGVLLPGPSMDITAVSMVVALHPSLAEAVAEAMADVDAAAEASP